jgi:hypothetical protein
MVDLPDWTEFNSGEHEHNGLDPLGLQAVGASIVGNRLMPGITNATRHVRYYSFFCWVFWTYWQSKPKKATVSQQRRWRVRLENILRSATLYRDDQFGGLVGVTKAKRINSLATNAEITVAGGDAATAFVPANYSASFRALGCGLWDEEKGARLTRMGEDLAVAFDLTVRRSPISRSALDTVLSDSAQVKVGTIRALTDGIGLRPVKPGEPEHRLLKELLLRSSTGTERLNVEFDQRRSLSFALLMEIVQQAGILASPLALHRIFATGKLPNGPRFAVPVELAPTFESWKRYQERQYLVLGIYALWHEIVETLDHSVEKTATAQQLITTILLAFEESKMAAKWLGAGYCRRTVIQVQQHLEQHVSKNSNEVGRWAVELSEVLADRKRNSPDRVGAAVALLLLSSCYWKSTSSKLPAADLHRDGGRERLSLKVLTDDAEAMRNTSIPEYLQFIVETYVLKQSTRVATQKLPDYRFFIIREDHGYRLVKKQDPNSYLTYSLARVSSAYDLMAGLKLIDREQGLRLTGPGQTVLRQLRAQHGGR